tara:strand:+ start:88 stop:300 length:213 start_codon:yes stop_codon:yes gene_type:complete
MGKPGPKAHSIINDLLKNARGKSPVARVKPMAYREQPTTKENTTISRARKLGFKGTDKPGAIEFLKNMES